MKNFHQNLLIFLALCLCALCVYQWTGQARQRGQINGLNQHLYDETVAIQEYTNRIATMDGQIARMDARIAEMTKLAKADTKLLSEQTQEIKRLGAANDVLTNQVAQYISVQETLEGRLKEAYAGIEKQNVALKELTTQRDEFVEKLNDSVKERNQVVTKYNELVKSLAKPSSK